MKKAIAKPIDTPNKPKTVSETPVPALSAFSESTRAAVTARREM